MFNRGPLMGGLPAILNRPGVGFCPKAVAAGALLMVAMPNMAQAFNLYDGTTYGNNLEINLTTTVSYTGLYRVNSPSAQLAGPTNLNSNDGDANFRSGIVGNLFEAVPVLDIRDGDYGAHFSSQLYLNTSYLGTNQNNQPNSLNSIYLAKHTDFTSGTRNVNGENAQVLDAFVFGQHEFSDGQSLQLKVGRQTLFWGQSLFFPVDGISGGQAPINVITAQDSINPQAQQVFMPVGQVVLTYQPVVGTTIQGYYQFEWEHDFFQGAGAYFNGADYLDKGAQTVIAAAGVPGIGNEYFLRSKDIDPEHQNGQFGLSIQQEVGTWDLGLYGLRFDAKAPVFYAYPGLNAGNVVPGGISAGTYTAVYPRDIWLQGVSFSTNLLDANVAGEFSAREHMPLIPQGFGIQSAANIGNANNDPLYPVGDTWDAQLSALLVTGGIPLDPGGVTLEGEIILQHVISVTQNRAALTQGAQATAGAFDFAIVPTYNEVLPNLQVTFPIGLTYNYLGRSQIDPAIYHGNGIFNIGVTGTYKTNWIATLSYQDFLGRPNTSYNSNADRGYVSLNLQHTF